MYIVTVFLGKKLNKIQCYSYFDLRKSKLVLYYFVKTILVRDYPKITIRKCNSKFKATRM